MVDAVKGDVMYRLMDKLDTLQPQIELVGNVVVVTVVVLAIAYYALDNKKKRMTYKWSDVSKGNFGLEVRKNG